MKKYIYCHKSQRDRIVDAENRKQCANKVFYNITVKPYKGRKYSSDYYTIIIG